MKLLACKRATPAGDAMFVFREAGAASVLVGSAFADFWSGYIEEMRRRFGAFALRERASSRVGADALAKLDAYVGGDLAALDGIPAEPGGTPFQQRVWAELRRIPAGTTITYGELARRVGDPKAVRAVGAANGRNPIPIVIPCHRVIAADGTLHGYGGGLEKKRLLLEHEGASLGRNAFQESLFR